jgi:hypothetical protein
LSDPEQLSELEDDLDRAWTIQGESLPKQDFKFNGGKFRITTKPPARQRRLL